MALATAEAYHNTFWLFCQQQFVSHFKGDTGASPGYSPLARTAHWQNSNFRWKKHTQWKTVKVSHLFQEVLERRDKIIKKEEKMNEKYKDKFIGLWWQAGATQFNVWLINMKLYLFTLHGNLIQSFPDTSENFSCIFCSSDEISLICFCSSWD